MDELKKNRKQETERKENNQKSLDWHLIIVFFIAVEVLITWGVWLGLATYFVGTTLTSLVWGRIGEASYIQRVRIIDFLSLFIAVITIIAATLNNFHVWIPGSIALIAALSLQISFFTQKPPFIKDILEKPSTLRWPARLIAALLSIVSKVGIFTNMYFLIQWFV